MAHEDLGSQEYFDRRAAEAEKHRGYYDQRHAELAEFARQLRHEFPEVLEAAASVDPPVMRLECPRGHGLLAITVEMDHNWHPFVAPVEETARGGKPVAEPAEPLHSGPYEAGADETRQLKTRLRCRRCTYDGNHTQITLLKLYAVALRYEMPSIRLPS